MPRNAALAGLLVTTLNSFAADLPPAPVARNDTYDLTTLTLAVSAPGILANDFGAGISVASYSLPTSGTINTIRTDGSFLYVPERGFAGTSTFGYSIVDASNRTASATVTIDASKSVPKANDDFFALTATALNVSAPGLLANDTGGIGAVTVDSYALPTSGRIDTIRTDGSLLYTPERGFAGVATFSYGVVDELGRGSTATVHIDAGASVPKAHDDFFALTATTLNVSAPGLLANDTGGIGAVTVDSYALPTSGRIDTIRTDGSLLYTPERGFAGVATFSYGVVDELGRGSTATVHIDAGASIPVAYDDSFSVRSGGTLEIFAPGLLANDTGGIGAITAANYTLPSSGTINNIRTDGSFLYQAALGFVGVAGFDYTVTDELGRLSSAHVTINVLAVPEPATWAMLLGGLFAVVGIGARRRA